MSRAFFPWWIALFLLGVILWSVEINRPVELPSWHEFDYAAIARNYVREGNNILLPRIDWRRDGPGFTEMEFPLIPWTMAQLYRVFGVHEIIGRLLSLLFTLGSLFVFCGIARQFLPKGPALVAGLFLVVNHLTVTVASALQPEALMLLCILLTVYFYVDWYRRQRWPSYCVALAAFALAVLVKAPAAHLAVFLFLWSLLNDGVKAFRRPALYLFAVLSLMPALLWYSHAAHLWQQYQNSMGVSNEDHWLGLDLVRRPAVWINLVALDLVYGLGLGGALVILAEVARDRFRTPLNRLALSWCAAIALYFVVILRTAGANWAFYYHAVAVPPLALLFGAGLAQVKPSLAFSWRRVLSSIVLPAGLFVGLIFWLNHRHFNQIHSVIADLAAAHLTLIPTIGLEVLCLLVTVLCLRCVRKTPEGTAVPRSISRSVYSYAVAAGCFSYLLISSDLLIGSWLNWHERSDLRQAAGAFASYLSAPGLLVASGGICADAGGHAAAHEAPEMFYWLERKGFSTCAGHESVAELQADEKRGARYFIAYKESLRQEPDFESEVRQAFPRLADAPAAVLFDLKERPKQLSTTSNKQRAVANSTK